MKALEFSEKWLRYINEYQREELRFQYATDILNYAFRYIEPRRQWNHWEEIKIEIDNSRVEI